jgi:hypothetical protein
MEISSVLAKNDRIVGKYCYETLHCHRKRNKKLIHSAKKRDFENGRKRKKRKEILVTQGMLLISAVMKKALLG